MTAVIYKWAQKCHKMMSTWALKATATSSTPRRIKSKTMELCTAVDHFISGRKITGLLKWMGTKKRVLNGRSPANVHVYFYMKIKINKWWNIWTLAAVILSNFGLWLVVRINDTNIILVHSYAFACMQSWREKELKNDEGKWNETTSNWLFPFSMYNTKEDEWKKSPLELFLCLHV